MRRAAAFLVLMASLAACSGGGKTSATEQTRVPDDEGVATQVTVERIQLDGERTYRLAIDVESFRSRTHQVTQLLFWKDKYVHVGLTDDRRVAWIAGLGIVQEQNPPVVQYAGILERVRDDRAYFKDGTVLRVADGVGATGTDREVVATIDTARDLATELRPA
jgi:hypothetical protein